MDYDVTFDERAANDIVSIFDYVNDQAGDDIAMAYVRRLEARCRAMGRAPLIGTPRPDLGSGLRSAPFERRATIVYRFDDGVVFIVRVIQAGRDIGRAFP